MNGTGDTAYYNYDGGGQRVRKVVVKSGKRTERLYLGGVERYREYSTGGTVKLERWTVQIDDIAQVDTLTVDSSAAVANPISLIRYQYRDHLGSASLETNESGQVISYEEYHPFGTSAYRTARSGTDLSLKRYRFTNKEQDDETGLYYFGVRYYAAWLGRWTSSDPGDFVDGLNMYVYVRNNPVNGVDALGYETDPPPPSEKSDEEDKVNTKFYDERGNLLYNDEIQNEGDDVINDFFVVNSAYYTVAKFFSEKLGHSKEQFSKILREGGTQAYKSNIAAIDAWGKINAPITAADKEHKERAAFIFGVETSGDSEVSNIFILGTTQIGSAPDSNDREVKGSVDPMGSQPMLNNWNLKEVVDHRYWKEKVWNRHYDGLLGNWKGEYKMEPRRDVSKRYWRLISMVHTHPPESNDFSGWGMNGSGGYGGDAALGEDLKVLVYMITTGDDTPRPQIKELNHNYTNRLTGMSSVRAATQVLDGGIGKDNDALIKRLEKMEIKKRLEKMKIKKR